MEEEVEMKEELEVDLGRGWLEFALGVREADAEEGEVGCWRRKVVSEVREGEYILLDRRLVKGETEEEVVVVSVVERELIISERASSNPPASSPSSLLSTS